MATTRRGFGKTMGAVGAATLWWDRAVIEVRAQGSLSDDLVRALLEAHGGAGVFASPARFAELKSALERAAIRLATLRAFPVPADVGPAVVFRR